jgi:hypothetical protein
MVIFMYQTSVSRAISFVVVLPYMELLLLGNPETLLVGSGGVAGSCIDPNHARSDLHRDINGDNPHDAILYCTSKQYSWCWTVSST